MSRSAGSSSGSLYGPLPYAALQSALDDVDPHGHRYWCSPACITFRYTVCVAQLVTRVDEDLLADIDRLVADGVVANRSEAVRLALERLVDQQQRQRVGSAIVNAYRRRPQTDEELAGLDEATRALVNEEPW